MRISDWSSDVCSSDLIDSFLDDGSTKEEWKMVVETKKILDPAIKLNATCVRVPVFVGHSEAVNIEFESELSAEQAMDILREAPGVRLIDKREDGGYVTPDRRSVVWGKSGSVRVDTGGCRSYKKKKRIN